jgi:predicted DNA-binding transcriptional regulator AlpA
VSPPEPSAPSTFSASCLRPTESRAYPRKDVLPRSLPPRGLSRVEAARYVGVGTALFDAMVKDGRMPPPKRINGRVVWDRLKLDAAFEALPDDEGRADDVWDRCAV